MVLLLWQNEVLLLLHNKHKKWMGPGGHIDPGELDHQAAERELFEETGLVVKFNTDKITSRATQLPVPHKVHSYADVDSLELDYTFVLRVDDVVRQTPLDPKEGHKLGWLDISFVEHLCIYKDTLLQIQELHEKDTQRPTMDRLQPERVE